MELNLLIFLGSSSVRCLKASSEYPAAGLDYYTDEETLELLRGDCLSGCFESEIYFAKSAN